MSNSAVDDEQVSGILCLDLIKDFAPIGALVRFDEQLRCGVIRNCLIECVRLTYESKRKGEDLYLRDIRERLVGQNAVTLHQLLQFEPLGEQYLIGSLERLIAAIKDATARKAVKV